MLPNFPRPRLAAFTTAIALLNAALASEPPRDLSEFRTVTTAIRAQLTRTGNASTGQSGYLGIQVEVDKKGKLAIAEIASDSPASKARLQSGDVLMKLDGKPVSSGDAVRDALQAKAPGEIVKFVIGRNRKTLAVDATLGATSRPKKLGDQRAVVGVQVGDYEEGEGVRITRLTPGMPAAKAGLKTNDIILKVDGVVLSSGSRLADLLMDRKVGAAVTLRVRRKDEEFEKQLELAADRGVDSRGGGPEMAGIWKKPAYRLAVIGVEFPDVKHNEKIPMVEWERAMFSTASYNKTNQTGATVYGSLNDYYLEQSCGALRVEGCAFEWLEVGKKRAEYSGSASQPQKTGFLTEVLDALAKRDGADALKGFDGVVFIYAGERYPTANRGSLFWPHRASVTYQGKRWSYFICAEGGQRMGNVSVFCHEFGHMLGLPDLYARPENPGSEGLGNWCAMSNQIGDGRPQHFGAWCKEQLGWLKPVMIAGTVKQKLVLAPVEGTTNECYKVLIRPDGSEYLLLENRRKKGFDLSLPGEGLLIWRVVGNRPMLEESHGVAGPAGPRVFLRQVPYPSSANDAYTPYTTPASRSLLGGGQPVHLTNIRHQPDGRITFQIGYEYQ